jgi:hypothetical protein
MLDSGVAFVPKSRIPVKSIALPVEHGSWGFLFEPLLAGLLIAPTIGGAFLSIFMIGAFLSRQPLKFVVGDYLQKKRLPRTAVAFRWTLYFASIATTGLIASIFTASPHSFVPLVIASPVVIYLILQDASRKSRETRVDLLAASVLAASIASLSLAAAHAYAFAAAMWLIMLARLIPSVALFLLVRSITGLSSKRRKLTAKQLGIREVVYGCVYALSVVAGYYAGF